VNPKENHMRITLLSGMLVLLLFSCIEQQAQISKAEKQQIITTLQEISELDQQYAGIPSEALREKYGNQKAWEIFYAQRDSIGLINQQKIKALYEAYGYLGAQKVGEDAATDFWLPIQHADNDIAFQQKMLEAMRQEIEMDSTDKYHYAMLEDRINVTLNQPQRFGSQLTYNELGQAIPKIGLTDSTIVDSLRAAYTLPSIKEYYNSMTSMHFEMNKAMFLEKGITEPHLYE
jgi:hypothetical protein